NDGDKIRLGAGASLVYSQKMVYNSAIDLKGKQSAAGKQSGKDNRSVNPYHHYDFGRVVVV
ncbi:MAG: hypothetical protein K2O09_05450, partial [Treponemataceae bacterium]|nr:hypothetical protein [Treponemataceae bacterium]